MPTPRPSWPLITPHLVYHVGLLDPALKGATHNATSLEGNGLSVSMNPEAWRQIARLGDHPTWSLSHDSARLIKARSLTKAQWSVVMTWAQAQGLATIAETVDVSWFDDEAGERRKFSFDLSVPGEEAAAMEEFEGLDDVQDPKMERLRAWKATPLLSERIGFDIDVSLTADLALTLYCEDVLFESDAVHGVWWDDELNVAALSAPRGVIHRRALNDWNCEYVADTHRTCATEKAR